MSVQTDSEQKSAKSNTRKPCGGSQNSFYVECMRRKCSRATWGTRDRRSRELKIDETAELAREVALATTEVAPELEPDMLLVAVTVTDILVPEPEPDTLLV